MEFSSTKHDSCHHVESVACILCVEVAGKTTLFLEEALMNWRGISTLIAALILAAVGTQAPAQSDRYNKYLGAIDVQKVTGSAKFASFPAEALSTSACRLLPCASMVTMTGKSLTEMCHMASGMPNSRKSTPSTFVMHFV